MDVDPDRALADLGRLAELTGGPDGARRVAWTDEWAKAREFLRERLTELPVAVDVDEAGNLWAVLEGSRPERVVIGSHVDSVPNGGWLDGALGVFGALEVLRGIAADGTPPVTVALVDWADEEGARFGRSLLGSSSTCGNMVPAVVRDLTDGDGVRLEDALAVYGVDLDRAHESGVRLNDVRAYLELHIEQGPVLEREGLPCGAVLGTVGVERGTRFSAGRPPTPARPRWRCGGTRSSAPPRLALELREIAIRHGGVCTTGGATSRPGIVTAVAGETRPARRPAPPRRRDARPDEGRAGGGGGRVSPPRSAARSTCSRCGGSTRSRSTPTSSTPFAGRRSRSPGPTGRCRPGPLHDAAEMVAQTGIPTVMVFSSSTNGISHAKEEDTPRDHLALAIRVYARAVEHAIARVEREASA